MSVIWTLSAIYWISINSKGYYPCPMSDFRFVPLAFPQRTNITLLLLLMNTLLYSKCIFCYIMITHKSINNEICLLEISRFINNVIKDLSQNIVW